MTPTLSFKPKMLLSDCSICPKVQNPKIFSSPSTVCPSRPVSSVHSATSVVHKTSTLAGDQSQPIVISDTPSPAVSIITIHSDSEDEDDRKFPAAW